MWEIMNGMTDRVRSRMAPRRRSGVGTMTAMVIGASVGIAAWEALRKTQGHGSGLSDGQATQLAQEVMDTLKD